MGRPKKNQDDKSEITIESEVTEETPKKITKKSDAFDTLFEQLHKKWGNSVAKASEVSDAGVKRISTGNLALDVATFGGIPFGRITRFYGAPKSAKTGSAFNLVTSCQRRCSVCFSLEECNCDNRNAAGVAWIDAEGRSNDNLQWMRAHGIDTDRLILQTPESGPQLVDTVDAILRAKGVWLVVVDSLANIISKEELEKATEDGSTIGRNAALINSALRKWQAALNSHGFKYETKPTLLLLNQERQKIGVMYGDPSVMVGGIGQDYATSLDVKFWRGKNHFFINDGTEEEPKWIDKQQGGPQGYAPSEHETPDYVDINFKVTTSSVGGVGRYGSFNYWLSNRLGHHAGDPDNFSQIFEFSKSLGLLTKNGSTYDLKGLQDTSQAKVRSLLAKDKKIQQILWNEITDKMCKVDYKSGIISE